MASKIPFTSHFPTSKRSACDRCRQQKLRCPQRDDDTHACARCVRAGLACKTGYTKPLGRSSQDDSNTFLQVGTGALNASGMDTAPTEHLGVKSTSPEIPFPPSITRGARTMSTMQPEMAVDEASSWHSGETNGNQSLYKESDWPIREDVFNDIFNCAVSPSMMHENQSFSANSFTNFVDEVDDGAEVCFDDPNLFQSANKPSETERTRVDNLPDQPTQQARTSRTCTVDKVLRTVECDLRLSQLNLDLSKQLQRHTEAAQRQESPDVNLQTTKNLFQIRQTDIDGEARSNAFGDALCSTSEYLTILQSYGHVSGVQSAVGLIKHVTAPSFHPHSSLSFACILNLVSSYLRIIAIFDRLFLLLHGQCCNSDEMNFPASPVAACDMQTLPGLYLAGFPVQQSSLQIKILIQTIQHQFELIEKALGLPVEMRVSERKEPYPNGLMDEELAEALVQATSMKQAAQPLDRRRTPRPDVNVAVPGSPASLRQNMSNLKQLLDV